MMKLDFVGLWRSLVTLICGGKKFDAPTSGYSFSAVLAEERKLSELNVRGDRRSALLCLSIADPVWKMSAGAMEAALQYYTASSDATRYTDNAGIRESCEHNFPDTHKHIAQFLSDKYLIDIGEDEVQYSPGAIKRALAEYIPTAFFDEKTCLVFPTPGYGVIKSPMNRRGAKVIDLPLKRISLGLTFPWTSFSWTIPHNKLKGYGRFRKRFMYVNVPHNPTGMVFDRDDWKNILSWAGKHKFKLIVDEAYDDIRFDETKKGVSVMTMPDWQKTCLVLQSVSKGWNATGLRLGWIAGDKTAIAVLRQVMDVKDSGMFGPSIAAGLACLSHPEWAQQTRTAYKELHKTLARGLCDASFTSEAGVPNAGLCQLTLAPRKINGVAFVSAAECAKWLREKMRISVMHYDVNGVGYLRWAVTTKPVPECGLMAAHEVIAEAMKRLIIETKPEF
jgi:aspartate/methionine/tyrosine aminotransferase